jgi:Tfp pilus assembly protein PilF
MEKNRVEAAIPWLEKAKHARRYEPRHFPHLNLGRIYLSKGMLLKAQEEFAAALRLHPQDEMAEKALRVIRSQLN